MLKGGDIELIRRSVTMPELAGKYGYSVTRSGYIKCPFHADHSPSMKVYNGDRGYYCFVCNAGGDVIDFVQRHDNLEFEPAVRHIAEMFNIPISDGNKKLSGPDKERIAKRRAEQEAEKERIRAAEKRLNDLSASILSLNEIRDEIRPFHDAWCMVTERIEKLDREWETLFDEIYEKR